MRISWLYFASAVRAGERAGLDLPAIRRDREIGDRRVLGLAGAVRHDAGVAGAVRHIDRGERLRQRADLVDLDQDRVADALLDAVAQPLDIGDEQIVADELAACRRSCRSGAFQPSQSSSDMPSSIERMG
jgi:hypothetical protein